MPEVTPKNQTTLKVTSCEEVLENAYVVTLKVQFSSRLMQALNTGRIPFELSSDGKEILQAESDEDGHFQTTILFEVPYPAISIVELKALVPMVKSVKQTVPPDLAYEFQSRVSSGKPIRHGEVQRVYGRVMQNPETGAYGRPKYVIEKDIIVEAGGTLILDPNTLLAFNPGVGLYSEGKIIMRGSKDKPVTLKPNTDEMWGGVAFNGPHTGGSTIKHCEFTRGAGTKAELRRGILRPFSGENDMNRYGGGLLVTNSIPDEPIALQSVTFRDCEADFGGGIAIFNSTVKADDITLEKNRARISGGGGFVSRADVVLKDSKVKNNNSEGVGGGITITHNSHVTWDNPEFTDNTADLKGNDAFVFDSDRPNWAGVEICAPLDLKTLAK